MRKLLFAAMLMIATPALAGDERAPDCKTFVAYLARVSHYVDAVMNGDMLYRKAVILSQQDAETYAARPTGSVIRLNGPNFAQLMFERANVGLDYHQEYLDQVYADCLNPRQ